MANRDIFSMRLLFAIIPILAISSCTLPIVPPQPGAAKNVVLVHGFLETGNSLSYLCQQLEKSGYDCQTIKLRPADGRGGLERLATNLKRDVDQRFGESAQISLVAFSMGGLVSRYYLQELDGAARCSKLITISTPHNGTTVAWAYPTLGARQMRPGSDFLKRLAASEAKLDGVSCVSYRTPFDLIILPSDSSLWPRAENHQHPVLLHPLMLTSRPILTDIQRHLAQPDKPAPLSRNAKSAPPTPADKQSALAIPSSPPRG